MVAADLVEVRLKPVWACGGACVEDRNDNYYGGRPAPELFEAMVSVGNFQEELWCWFQ